MSDENDKARLARVLEACAPLVAWANACPPFLVDKLVLRMEHPVGTVHEVRLSDLLAIAAAAGAKPRET